MKISPLQAPLFYEDRWMDMTPLNIALHVCEGCTHHKLQASQTIWYEIEFFWDVYARSLGRQLHGELYCGT